MMETLFVALFLQQFTVPVHPSQPKIERSTQTMRGALDVSVVQTNARSFPPGTQRVPMLSLTLQASCATSVSIESITVQRRGMGDRNDIAAAYFVEGEQRVTNSQQLQRNGTVTLPLRLFSVPSCKKRTISLLVDIADTAAISGEHSFILGASGVHTENATVRMGAATNTLDPKITAGPARGTIDVTYPRVLNTIHYGSGQAILRLRLRANALDDHAIHAITVSNEGSARGDDLQKIFFETGASKRVTAIASELQGDTVRLVFDPPFIIERNKEKLLTLRADVRASRSRTLRFVVQQPSDIESSVRKGRW